MECKLRIPPQIKILIFLSPCRGINHTHLCGACKQLTNLVWRLATWGCCSKPKRVHLRLVVVCWEWIYSKSSSMVSKKANWSSIWNIKWWYYFLASRVLSTTHSCTIYCTFVLSCLATRWIASQQKGGSVSRGVQASWFHTVRGSLGWHERTPTLASYTTQSLCHITLQMLIHMLTEVSRTTWV